MKISNKYVDLCDLTKVVCVCVFVCVYYTILQQQRKTQTALDCFILNIRSIDFGLIDEL